MKGKRRREKVMVEVERRSSKGMQELLDGDCKNDTLLELLAGMRVTRLRLAPVVLIVKFKGLSFVLACTRAYFEYKIMCMLVVSRL